METNSRKIIRRLVAEGWEEISVRGSHHKFRKDGMTIIVPHPKKDLPRGTASAIADTAGWRKRVGGQDSDENLYCGGS